MEGTFFSVTRTPLELSAVCDVAVVPAGVTADGPWSVLAVRGPLELNMIGVLARLATPLATAGISIFAVSTYDTDHVLVRSHNLDAAVRTLREAGHVVTIESTSRSSGPGLVEQAPAGSIQPDAQKNPFVATWTANLAKSKLDPSSRFQGITLDITVAGDTMTMAATLVTASGEEQRMSETFRTDGTETAGTLGAGVVLMARWLGTHVLASVAQKDGQVVAIVTYEVSADGKTLTARSFGTLEQVIVYAPKIVRAAAVGQAQNVARRCPMRQRQA